jgi:hypothetical protein
MNVRVRSLGDLRHTAILAAAGIVALAAVAAIFMTGGDSTSRGDEGAASLFGLGRSSVSTTPGAAIAGAMQLPAGYTEQKVRYTITGDGEAATLNIVGRGVEFEFTAPATGTVWLRATATAANGSTIHTKTRFVLGDPGTFAGIELRYDGKVRIDGGRAVTGEADRAGARIDASHGTVSYLARVASDGSTTGRIEFSGSDFQAGYMDKGRGQRTNMVEVTRDGTKVSKLHVEAESHPESHYIEVSTPDAVAMVKGTGFDVTVSPGASRVDVDHGVVGMYDRFRYYVSPRDLPGTYGMEVKALDLALAAELAGKSMQAGGGMLEARGTHGVTTRPDQAIELEDQDDVLDTVLDNERISETQPLGDGGDGPIHGTAGDDGFGGSGVTETMTDVVEHSGIEGAGSDAAGTDDNAQLVSNTSSGSGPGGDSGASADAGAGDTSGTAGAGSGETTGSSGGSTCCTTGGGTGTGGSTTTGTGSSGSTDSDSGSTPEPKPSPPAGQLYTLETFEPTYARCLGTHVLWNGSYGDDAPKHRCVPKSQLSKYLSERVGYRPMGSFGCYRLHGVWKANSDGTPQFCYPLSQSNINALGTYEPPRYWEPGPVYGQLPCSTGHFKPAGSNLCKRGP